MFQFDFIQYKNERTFFVLYDKDVNNILGYLYWENGILYSVDAVAPTLEVIGSYPLGEEFLLYAIVNFESDTIQYTLTNGSFTQVQEVEFFNLDATTAGYYTFDWLYGTDVNWTFDDFRIALGAINNATAPLEIVEGDSYLDTGHFCAIDWETDSFVSSDCVARGYSSSPKFNGLCLMRSCFNDMVTYVFVKAQANLLRTLLIVIVIVLLAPIFVKLGSGIILKR